jgi:dipeptidyl aminopeptidase/acylaminoacyl peptidase
MAGFLAVLGTMSFAAATSLVPVGFVAVTSGSGSLQIASFRLDGSGERHLTSGPADHHLPSVSTDGRQLLYSGNEGGTDEIYRLDLAHPAAPTQITHPPLRATSAAWSPDGRSIVYSALVPGSAAYQIFAAGEDGTNPVQLTRTVDSGNAQPVFSPDGRHIAYINGREASSPGPDGSTVSGFSNQIWVMDADGSNARAITLGPLDAYPAWVDSSTVAFARTSFLSDSSQVVAVGLDGRVRVLSPANQYFIEPKPLPDGRSYGATLESGSVLHLVRVSRRDGAALTAPQSSEFNVDVLPVPAADGSSLSVAWIMGPVPVQATRGPIPLAVFVTAGAGALLLLLVAVAVSRKTNAC